jgi:hypothetical protein
MCNWDEQRRDSAGITSVRLQKILIALMVFSYTDFDCSILSWRIEWLSPVFCVFAKVITAVGLVWDIVYMAESTSFLWTFVFGMFARLICFFYSNELVV